MSFHVADSDQIFVKDRRCEPSFDSAYIEDIGEVLRRPSATRRNHWNAHCLCNLPRKVQVVSVILPIVVDAIQQNLAATKCLDRLSQLHHIQTAPLSTALHCALIPADALACWSTLALVGGGRVVYSCVATGLGGTLNPHAARIDGDDHRLAAIHVRNLFDG